MSFRADFITGERNVSKKDSVRTDTLLRNIFAYMLRNKYNFDTATTMNEKEKDILEIYKTELDFFGNEKGQKIRNQFTELDVVNEDTIIDSVLYAVADELFSEGITWSLIIAYFVFVKEFTLFCIYDKKLKKSIVDVVFECFAGFVKQKLKRWIEDHGNWEGIQLKKENSFKSSWFKLLLRTSIKTFGIFSSVSNVVHNNIS